MSPITIGSLSRQTNGQYGPVHFFLPTRDAHFPYTIAPSWQTTRSFPTKREGSKVHQFPVKNMIPEAGTKRPFHTSQPADDKLLEWLSAERMMWPPQHCPYRTHRLLRLCGLCGLLARIAGAPQTHLHSGNSSSSNNQSVIHSIQRVGEEGEQPANAPDGNNIALLFASS